MMEYQSINYRRIKMFLYDHGGTLFVTLGVAIVVGSFYLLLSIDCSTGGSCTLANDGLANAVLGPRK